LSDNLEKRVFQVLREVFPSLNDEINYEWGPNEVSGWDSLNHLNLIMTLNKKFKIEITFEEVLSIEKIEDIFLLLKNKGINS
jgi:acyl carrier protein